METIFTFKKLYIAYLDCRQTKRNAESALEFEFELERNLYKLLAELKEKKYVPGQSICFVVREPKPREVFAAGFRDRVVHHLLVNELQPAGERVFIHDSYACRPEKGTHRAVVRLRDFIKKGLRRGRDLHFLQLDIDGFFMNINKIALMGIIKNLVHKQKRSDDWKNDVLWLAKTIVGHDPTKDYRLNSPPEYFRLIPDRKSLFKQPSGKGLPIGNYTSQFFANLYMNELDQFIKRKLKCRYYVRYVDDFILLHEDPAVLRGVDERSKALCF